MNAEYLVDGIEGLLLGGPHLVQTRLGGVAISNLLGPLAILIVQHGVHTGRISGAFGLRHGCLGHHAMLSHQVHEHIPLPAVFHTPLQQPGYGTVIHWPV